MSETTRRSIGRGLLAGVGMAALSACQPPGARRAAPDSHALGFDENRLGRLGAALSRALADREIGNAVALRRNDVERDQVVAFAHTRIAHQRRAVASGQRHTLRRGGPAPGETVRIAGEQRVAQPFLGQVLRHVPAKYLGCDSLQFLRNPPDVHGLAIEPIDERQQIAGG